VQGEEAALVNLDALARLQEATIDQAHARTESTAAEKQRAASDAVRSRNLIRRDVVSEQDFEQMDATATGFALFPGPKQAVIAAILGMSGSLAPTIGPALGGWITETYSWHWLFFVNVVPGVIIAGTIPFLGQVDDPNPALVHKFDIIGLGLMAIALASLEYVLEEGYRWGWLDDPGIRNFAWLAATTGGLFIWRSLRHPSPVVDLQAFRNPTSAIATLLIFVTGFGLFGAVYVLPLFRTLRHGRVSPRVFDQLFGGIDEAAGDKIDRAAGRDSLNIGATIVRGGKPKTGDAAPR
jgi:MFS family permease